MSGVCATLYSSYPTDDQFFAAASQTLTQIDTLVQQNIANMQAINTLINHIIPVFDHEDLVRAQFVDSIVKDILQLSTRPIRGIDMQDDTQLNNIAAIELLLADNSTALQLPDLSHLHAQLTAIKAAYETKRNTAPFRTDPATAFLDQLDTTEQHVQTMTQEQAVLENNYRHLIDQLTAYKQRALDGLNQIQQAIPATN